jgi:PDZ domain-containing secreted protein
MMDVTDGGAVVSGPGVIHDGGEVMEIAGVSWRMRNVDSDGTEELLIPKSCGRLLSVRLSGSAGGHDTKEDDE